MNYYAGLDVSLEETAICMVDEAGAIVRELRALRDPESLVLALGAVGLPMERIGLEACSLFGMAASRPDPGGPAGAVH